MSFPTARKRPRSKARTGYVVETEKVWYKDLPGNRSRELLHTSNYRAYQQVIEYNYWKWSDPDGARRS